MASFNPVEYTGINIGLGWEGVAPIPYEVFIESEGQLRSKFHLKPEGKWNQDL